MNYHLRLLQIMNYFTKWTKVARNNAKYSKLGTLLYEPKFLSYRLTKFQTHKDVVNNVNSESKTNNYLKSKFDELVVWYEQLSGMDEVRIAQKRVIDAQDRLILAQEQRRESSKQLSAMHNKLKEIYSDLETTTRGEERYLQLITKEHKLLREEKRLQEEFGLSEQEERNAFTVLSSTVKDSHEKERAQAEKTKYWSLIGSIIGTVIGVVGSSINNEFKMRELRKMIKETAASRAVSTDINIETSEVLSKLEKHISAIANDVKSSSNSSNYEVGKLIHSLNNTSNTAHSDLLEEFLQQQRFEMKLVLLGAAVLGIVIPLVVRVIS